MFALLDHLALPVVAEGVEDEETLTILRGLGCERWQGWLLSPAVPADRAAELLQAAPRPPRTGAADGTPVETSAATPLAEQESVHVGALVSTAVVVDEHRSCLEVEELFHGSERLRTVVVARDDGTWSTLTAATLHGLMSGRYGYGRALNSRRPVGEVVTAQSRPLPPDAALVDATSYAMARDADERYDDLLVVGDGGEAGLLSVSRMMEVLSASLTELAIRDDLTGLPNRRHFLRRVGSWVDAGDDVGVLYLDLDGFKPDNDTHGHAAGDAVLAAAGSRLRACARPRDVVARLGGDEFALAVHGPNAHQLPEIAARVQRVLHAPVEWAGTSLPLTVSIGLAAGRWGHTDEVVAAADQSMYVAKRDAATAVGPLVGSLRPTGHPTGPGAVVL